jgi:hypothetical protein
MGTIRFLLGVVVSAAFVAMGLLMALWPGTYLRWVRWSKVESYAPWLVRARDPDHSGWQIKIIGIALALLGITAVVLWVYIRWFQ